MDLATRWRAIDENSRSVSPAPSSLQPPQPTPSSTRPPTITINEAFELQRLQAEFTKAADEADVLSFFNVKVLGVLRSMREEQTARKKAEAKCGALEKELHRARASIAGQAVSSSRGAVPLPSGAPEGHGFQSQRSLRRHVKDCEDWLQEKYPNDELKQAQVARGLAGKLYADRDLSEHHKTTATKDAIIRGLCAFYSRWDPQLLDSSSWLIREKNKPYSNRGEYTRASGMRPVWPFIPAADGQLSDNNAEDEHGFDLRWDPQLLDSSCWLIREKALFEQRRVHTRKRHAAYVAVYPSSRWPAF